MAIIWVKSLNGMFEILETLDPSVMVQFTPEDLHYPIMLELDNNELRITENYVCSGIKMELHNNEN